MTSAEKETLAVFRELGLCIKQVHALKKENAALKAIVEKFTSTNMPSMPVCPHYFKATDGVHKTIIDQCGCMGKPAHVG
jgi:hypothetical protein